MLPAVLIAGVLSLATTSAYGCSDGHGDDHVHARRATPSVPLPPPSRALEWGDINIIHTTDTHGWLLGHQKTSFPEPNYSGDFGEFASFVSHMKQIAKKKNVDLLLVDSGDLHDGTGLSDGGPIGSINAHDSNKFFEKLPYDVLAIGNHELYVYNNTLDMYKAFAPHFRGRYLSSNVNITLTDEASNTTRNIPVGSRYAKFKTAMGRKVTALGVLFNFAGNANGTTVQKVADMVKEPWFADAIKDEPDLFLLAGHMPIAKDNWPLVFNAIRVVHPATPIIILGGHTHIRDCLQLDNRSMSLESGRYMETVGWLSAKLDKKGSTAAIQFSRRYLDPNRVTYEYHTSQTNHSFDTTQGKGITKGLTDLAKRFSLDFKCGVAPRDFTVNQAPYPSDGSLLSLYIQNAAPTALALNNTHNVSNSIIIANSGLHRFDLYAGPFTKNDQLTSTPFSNKFVYVAGVKNGDAKKVLPALNNAGAANRRRGEGDVMREDEDDYYKLGYVGRVFRAWLEEMDKRNGVERRQTGNQTLGYVTKDSCPGIGDDILHTPLPFNSLPDFISSTPPNVPDDTPIDLVFLDFIQVQLLTILNSVQSTKNFTASDVGVYSPILSNQVLGLYAQKAWN